MAKKTFDIILSIILLLPVLFIIIIISYYVRKHIGSPIFFTQNRIGKHCKTFKIIKFRTMQDLRDYNGILLPDQERLNHFGIFLRSTSLDELPELFNVIKGEMSLVGPRPLLEEYLPLYSKEQNKRHDVLPGITGWAQINGRNTISWEDKFKLDIWYVDNQSFFLDFKIILITIIKVFKKDGISANGIATMHRFEGNRRSKK